MQHPNIEDFGSTKVKIKKELYEGIFQIDGVNLQWNVFEILSCTVILYIHFILGFESPITNFAHRHKHVNILGNILFDAMMSFTLSKKVYLVWLIIEDQVFSQVKFMCFLVLDILSKRVNRHKLFL